MDKKIKVIICEPNKAPRVEEVTERLETWQGIVGGPIDVIYPHDDDTCIILNDEGKIYNLPLNRALKTDDGAVYDVICGAFAIARAPEDSDDFESLTDEQIERYTKQYADYIIEDDSAYKNYAEPRLGFVPLVF